MIPVYVCKANEELIKITCAWTNRNYNLQPAAWNPLEKKKAQQQNKCDFKRPGK